MNCAELEILLCDYIDGTLAAGARAEVERHLAECAACAGMAHDVRTAVDFVGRAEAVEPPVAAADKALETGASDELVQMLTRKVADGVRDRFNDTLERKKGAEKSVEAGRKFVEAYVPFTHYVERLYAATEQAHGH